MRLLQTGDLHLGKMFYDYSLYEDQKYILDKYNYPVKEFFCDTDEDVASLPTSKSAGNDKCLAGSVAKVANGNEYRLNNQDQWVKKVVSSAGGGGTVSAKVEQTEDGAIITIEDSSGETTASIENGKNGADGKNGKDGSKGAGFFDA